MSSNRRTRRRELHTGLESLEGRELMTGGGIYGLDGKYINKFDYQKLLAKRENPPEDPEQRRVVLELPKDDKGHKPKVVLTLYGPGALISDPKLTPGTPEYNAVNTHVDAQGLLHIIFDGTTKESQIIGAVKGTRKYPKIAQIRDADVSPFDTTGLGTNAIGYVNLSRFDLAVGGRINLSAGVQRIFLNDIGFATQIDVTALADPPLTSPQNPGGLNSTTTTSSSGSAAVAGGGTQSTTSTTINGITVITTRPTVDQITISNGELTGVGGLILPGAIPSTSGNQRLEIQGVSLVFRNVKGSSTDPTPKPRLGKEFLAGTNDANDTVIFYDVERDPKTFALQSATVSDTKLPINVDPPTDSNYTFAPNADLKLMGAGLSEYSNGTYETSTGISVQVVAVGYSVPDITGTTRYFVNTYSVIDGTFQGWFEVGTLADDKTTVIPLPFDGIGGSSGDLYLTSSGVSDSNPAGSGSNTTGFMRRFDLTSSVESKLAVPVGAGFDFPTTFNSKGGTTGVSGLSYVFSAGLSYFRPYNPENPDPQLGVMSLNFEGGKIVQKSTAQVGTTVLPWDSNVEYVMGSIDQNVLMVNPDVKTTGPVKLPSGQEVTRTYYKAQLVNPSNLSTGGSINLYDGQESVSLTGLSESFYPQLLGGSVIDVRGNLKTFSATNVDNMVLNVNGIAGYVRADRATNTTILGRPVFHLAVGSKPGGNVDIYSTARPTNETPGGKDRPGDRGGVRIIKGLPILGPLVNPASR